MEVQIQDYDATLFYLHRMACPELVSIMSVTSDDFLAKKISDFVHAFTYESDIMKVENAYESLLHYLDHVLTSQIH